MNSLKRIHTVGHSNHSWCHFLELLREAGVLVVLDVRSHPYARRAKHFSKSALASALRAAGLSYFFLGQQLGGRPQGEQWYHDDGSLNVDRVRQSAPYLEGLARVHELGGRAPAVLLCSEEDPAQCHRHHLVGESLVELGWVLSHLRGDGSEESEAQLIRRLQPQLAFF